MKVKFDQEQNFNVSFGEEGGFSCDFEGIPKGDYAGSYVVTPSGETQTLSTSGKTLIADITINPVPSQYGLISWDGSAITVS